MGDIILEDCGDVFLFTVRDMMRSQDGIANLWKIALAIADQKTCLTASSISDYNKLLRVGGWLCHICSGLGNLVC